MTHLEAFEAAADAGVRMFVRAGVVILAPELGNLDAELQKELERYREPIRNAVLTAAEVIKRAKSMLREPRGSQP